MDAVTSTPPDVRNVPLDQVHDDGDDMRRTKVSARSDAALTSSIRRRGVLQAIGVRPNGNGYKIVFGRGRLRCARAAGLAEIPADIREWRDDEIRAVQGAENMQRRPVHPIDAWLTVRDLVDQGYSITEAAEELGLDDRASRQMERLGRLPPELLALAEIQMPIDHHLRIIANAPAKTQKAAAKGKLKTTGPDGKEIVLWNEITERCKVNWIPQHHAIFDAQAHPELWEEDLFAQPDDKDRIRTSDVAKFMKLQKAALDARIAEFAAKNKRVGLGEYSAASWPPVAVPKGWKIEASHPPANGWKPKKTEAVFIALAPDGHIAEVLAVDVAAQKAADKAKADRQQVAAGPAHTQGDDDGEQDGEGPATGGADREEAAISKAGLDLIAAAKTEALHAAVAATLKTAIAPFTMLRLLLLALAASNVELRPYDVDYEEVVAKLVTPGGQPVEIDRGDLAGIASNALTRILRIGGPSTYSRHASGDAAEWAGAMIDAGAHLPRFDTADFLKHVKGAALVEMADAAGIKSTGTVSALRARLVGQLPKWRPHAAQFGAPGPAHE